MRFFIVLILFAFFVACKKKEVDPHLLPNEGIVVNLCPSDKISDGKYYKLPELLKCGAPAQSVGNVIATLRQATVEELSYPQNCQDSAPEKGERIRISEGTAIRLDVSYYKNIGRIVFDVAAFNYRDLGAVANCQIILKDTDGKKVEVIQFADQVFKPQTHSSTKSLANLKEVVIVCGRGAGSIGDISLER